jgi:hypothetical protein
MTPGSYEVVARVEVTSADPVPPVAGFVGSPFAPMLREAARRCLGEPDGEHPAAGLGERTAILLASVYGDATTLDVAGEQLARGALLDPLLFHQTVPTAILGVLARDHGITGPIQCVSAPEDLEREALDMAGLLLADGCEQVLLLLAELAPTERVRLLHPRQPPWTPVPGATGADTVQALLLRRPGPGNA